MKFDLLMAVIKQEKPPGYEWLAIGMGLVIVVGISLPLIFWWIREGSKSGKKKKKKRKR